MNDYMEYMNALSATTSVNEQAQNAYESMLSYKDQAIEAKDSYKQQFAILPELVAGGSGEFLIKEVAGKALSSLTDTAKAGAKNLLKSGLKKAGVSEEDAEAMAESAVSGDIQGVASRGANIVTNAVSDVAQDAGNVVTNVVSDVRQIAGDAITQIQGGGDVVEALTGAVGRVGDVATGVAQQGAELAGRVATGAQGIADAATDVVEQGTALATGLAEQSQGAVAGAIETAQGLAGGAVSAAQGAVAGAVEAGAQTIAEVGGGVFADLPMDQDSVLSMLSRQARVAPTNDALPEGAGTIIGERSTIISRQNPVTSSGRAAEQYPLEEWSDDFGAVNRASTLPSEFEMVNMADRTPPEETPVAEAEPLPEGAPTGVAPEVAPTAEVTPTVAPTAEVAPAAAEAGAGAGADIGADVAIDVGAEVGLEAAGAALDSTGILAPLGALVGLLGGLGGLFGLEKHQSAPLAPPPPPLLNASTNFGT